MKDLVIGIDIGGTNTVFGIVDARGNVLASGSIKTRSGADFNDYTDILHREISSLVNRQNLDGRIRGIGIGAPNGNYYTGMIETQINLPWPAPIPLVPLLSEKFGIPVAVTNDANAAAIGEMTYGVARSMKHFIMITLGTGVGSGVVIDGNMVYGYDGMAGELGHITARRQGRQCACGRRGCLETYCSATGVVTTAREFLAARPAEESVLREIPECEMTSKNVFDAAVKGDRIALDVFEFTGKVLGESLADFASFTSPEAFVLFGGLANAGDLIMKPLIESFEANNMPMHKGKIKILTSALPHGDAAILGASALAWQL